MKNQDQKAQQTYIELQMVASQIKEQEKQMQALEEQIVNMAMAKQSVEEFSKIDGEKESLVPITNGVFAKAKLSKDKKVIVNVGSNIAVEKTPEEAAKIIEKQFIEMQKLQRQALDNITKLTEKAQNLEMEITKKGK